jgi:uncharacterized protein YndB with AHSA1/START domain
MAETIVNGIVPLSPDDAFDIFVNQINIWWPRHGVFPYSFAPKSTGPLHIRFEPGEHGRFYETFLDGSEYVIGQITEWQPPGKLVHTWRDPTWDGETTKIVTFHEVEGGTRISLAQDCFAAIGLPDMPAYYTVGNRQTLAGFIAYCVATHELRQLES